MSICSTAISKEAREGMTPLAVPVKVACRLVGVGNTTMWALIKPVVYVFNAGYWAPRVGFYGGINYGFGYAGVGYQGGYWNNGAFFYNSAANNVSM
jgi:hypothetical protein